MAKHALVAGSVNMDLVVQVERFPKEGETLRGKRLTRYPGGKGANQAAALVLQGVSTTMWGCAGQDTYGEAMVQHLEALSIRSFVAMTPETTGIALIETNAQGQNRIVIVPGANNLFSIKKIQSQLFLLDEADAVVLQCEIPIESVEYIAAESKKRKKLVILNPAPATYLKEELLSQVDYLIPNEHELAILTKLPTKTVQEIHAATQLLHKKGVKVIIVTLGEKGCYYSNGDFQEMIPAFKTSAVDTTGAGDAFIGGFVGALLRTGDEHYALQHANAVAALSVTKQGAFGSAGTWEETKKFLEYAGCPLTETKE